MMATLEAVEIRMDDIEALDLSMIKTQAGALQVASGTDGERIRVVTSSV